MLGVARRKSLRKIGPAVSAFRGNQADLSIVRFGPVRSISCQNFPGGLNHLETKWERADFIKIGHQKKWSRSFSSEDGDLVDAVVPHMGESISDGTLSAFLKKPGDSVRADEPIAQVETDKVTIDVNCPEAGVLQKYVANEGDTVTPGTKIAVMSKSAVPVTHATPSEEKSPEKTPLKLEAEPPKPKQEAPKSPPPKVSTPVPARVSALEPQLPP